VIIKNRLKQAYKQAPWRLHTQKGLLFLILAILGASILWIMVTVSVEASAAGLDIQWLNSERDRLERENASMVTEYASLTSAASLADRAKDLGFEKATTDSISYVYVDGYQGRKVQISAPPPGSDLPPILIRPEYTVSLSEWMLQGILQLNRQSLEVSP
jgi:hypothetical protein